MSHVRRAAAFGQGEREPMGRYDVRTFDDARGWSPGRYSGRGSTAACGARNDVNTVALR